jgi:gamma-glutamylputrescine oxidase
MQLGLSYWDIHYYKEHDYLILGGGIVGITTAIQLKYSQPWKSVLVIDESWLGGGASSKNAGFVCIGSPTEIMDDILHEGEDLASELIARRWEGTKRLLSIVPQEKMDYQKVGGLEVFDQEFQFKNLDLPYLNSVLENVTKVENYFSLDDQNISDSFHTKGIFMAAEGRINPKKMMEFLYQKAISLGVHFLNDTIEEIDQSKNIVYTTKHGKLLFGRCGITLNGYINKLLPESKVTPARNLVLITNDLPEIKWDHVVHYNQGYVYFRRIGDKILLGGARNLDKDNEYSHHLEVNNKIEFYLLDFLKHKICAHHSNVEVLHQYIGILGFGESKIPKLKPLNSNICIASGMGGMGVAIGSQIGKELADFLIA